MIEYLKSGNNKSSVRLIVLIISIAHAIAIVCQSLVQVVNAFKGDDIFQPNWVGIGTAATMAIGMIVTQKTLAEKGNVKE